MVVLLIYGTCRVDGVPRAELMLVCLSTLGTLFFSRGKRYCSPRRYLEGIVVSFDYSIYQSGAHEATRSAPAT